jgi:hypothetical protein
LECALHLGLARIAWPKGEIGPFKEYILGILNKLKSIQILFIFFLN